MKGALATIVSIVLSVQMIFCQCGEWSAAELRPNKIPHPSRSYRVNVAVHVESIHVSPESGHQLYGPKCVCLAAGEDFMKHFIALGKKKGYPILFGKNAFTAVAEGIYIPQNTNKKELMKLLSSLDKEAIDEVSRLRMHSCVLYVSRWTEVRKIGT